MLKSSSICRIRPDRLARRWSTRQPDFDPRIECSLVAATDGWYEATAEERDVATDELGRILRDAGNDGARLLASFDDDLFLTGQPAPLPYTIFVLYDVDDLSVVVRLVHRVRTSQLGRFLRLEARVGRHLFVLDH